MLDVIKLAAYVILHFPVKEKRCGISGMAWSRVRDSSFCLLSKMSEVCVPYAIFHHIAGSPVDEFKSEEVRCFIACLDGLIEAPRSESTRQLLPWKLWETYGAYFHALRINALMIIGKKEIRAKDLSKWLWLKAVKIMLC